MQSFPAVKTADQCWCSSITVQPLPTYTDYRLKHMLYNNTYDRYNKLEQERGRMRSLIQSASERTDMQSWLKVKVFSCAVGVLKQQTNSSRSRLSKVNYTSTKTKSAIRYKSRHNPACVPDSIHAVANCCHTKQLILEQIAAEVSVLLSST